MDPRTILTALLLVHAAIAPAWAQRVTERVSVGAGGEQADGESFSAEISANGRYVAFYSEATNLVPGDTNGVLDVFVRDLRAGTTERVSVGPGGRQGDSDSGRHGISLSAGGRYVAFASEATNLVPGDTNGALDVFVRDRQAGTTERVNIGPGGRQADVGGSGPSISAGGRFVAFYSNATNLVPGGTNGMVDIFVRDRLAGTTERVSVGPDGRQADDWSFNLSISANGRYVAFESYATNLVPGDTNGFVDAFVRDRRAGTTSRVSVGSDDRQANGESYPRSISADGRYVAFTSEATNLVSGDTNSRLDVFVRDRRAGTTERVSVGPDGRQADSSSILPSISADGRYVAFTSFTTNLVPGDTNGTLDEFVRDRRTGTTTRVSVGPGGRQADSYSGGGSISAGGRVAFDSAATNLVPGDTNGYSAIFVRRRGAP